MAIENLHAASPESIYEMADVYEINSEAHVILTTDVVDTDDQLLKQACEGLPSPIIATARWYPDSRKVFHRFAPECKAIIRL